jgi:para-nitrobenzyl esterase
MLGKADGADQLTDRVQAAWLGMTKAGDPGWARYDTTARTTHLFARSDRDVDDPESVVREAWEVQR